MQKSKYVGVVVNCIVCVVLRALLTYLFEHGSPKNAILAYSWIKVSFSWRLSSRSQFHFDYNLVIFNTRLFVLVHYADVWKHLLQKMHWNAKNLTYALTNGRVEKLLNKSIQLVCRIFFWHFKRLILLFYYRSGTNSVESLIKWLLEAYIDITFISPSGPAVF